MSELYNKLGKKLKTKEGMLQATAVAALTIIATTVTLFFYEIRKNKKAKLPLGYKPIDKSKIRKITDRSGDIVEDRYHPSRVMMIYIVIDNTPTQQTIEP